MDIIFSASILAAFFAGMVALFAPCCITVLLPAYLASAFREKKNILKMTFVFFAGISVVLIPIGMGAAGLAELIKDFHREMYIFGGVVMIFLAFMSVSGKGFSVFPMSGKWRSQLNVSHTKSVFLLGIFSGAATSCCAPVLAGAVTLAIISGGFWKALIVTFAYVFGMTFPLFVTAFFYDRFQLDKLKIIRGKIFDLKVFNKVLYVHTTNLLAGLVFLTMGIALISLAYMGNVFWAPELQVKIGEKINLVSLNLLEHLKFLPDFVWGIFIISLFLGLIFYALFRDKKKK